ncbi:MAG: hypothetical protein WD271_14250 [Acidimicrobiia bacterium]
MRRGRGRRVLLPALAVGIVAFGCSTQGLAVKQSDRVQVVRPRDLTTTEAPARITWDARPLAPRQRFAVFVDQQPMAPGESLESLADDTCKATPGCPDELYLAAHFIFVTRGHNVTVPVLPFNGPFPVNDLYGLHAATIVIVDGAGRRVGEDSWSTNFFVERPSLSGGLDTGGLDENP